MMKIVVSNTIRITDPEPAIRSWAVNDLTLDNPEYIKKQRMGFWVGNTPRKLSLYEVDGGDLILPYGCLQELVERISGYPVDYRGDFHLCEPVDFRCRVPLYDYQEKAVRAMWVNGGGILQAPAGCGKTQIGLALVSMIGRRTLWLTHTLDLLKQSRDRALLYMDQSLTGTITGGKVNIGSGITFATVQTMCKLDLDRYRDVWDVVIVDECHRAVGTPTSVTRFSKVLNGLAAQWKFGLSATVHRSDGMIRATYALLGPIAYTVPDEAVNERVMPVEVHPIATHIGLGRGCTNTDGTLNYTGMITYLTKNTTRNAIIARMLIEKRGIPSLILSDRLEHLESLMKLLPVDMRDKAVMISGKMVSKQGKAEREAAIEGMRTRRYLYLFATYSLAKEGLDIPCLERLYMATPQKDYAVVTQSIGRIARRNPGKQPPVCYDFVDDVGYLKKAFRERCRHYRKANCTIIGE